LNNIKGGLEMKKRFLFLLVLVVFICFSLIPINILNAGPAGTTVTVTKAVTSESEGYLTWSIKKKADITSININIGQTATVNYTVNVKPTYHEVRKTVSGAIRVNNTGAATANVTYVRDRIEYKIGSGPWTEISTTNISGPVAIPVAVFSNFPYSIIVTAVEGATKYRNTAIVGVSNAILSGGGTGFREYRYTTEFSNSGGTVISDAFADVTDSLVGYLGEAWVGDAATQTYSYSHTYGPYTNAGNYTIENTATVTGKDKLIEKTSTVKVKIKVKKTGTDK
jgi:hypothetical protein